MTSDEVNAVTKLNNTHEDAVGYATNKKIKWLMTHSHRALVFKHDLEVIGYLFTFAPNTGYKSPNYGFYLENYPDASYEYLDRIAIGNDYQNIGLGTRVYNYLCETCKFENLFLEVSAVPPNPGSKRFH